MDIEKLVPLLIIWVIWRIVSRIQTGPPAPKPEIGKTVPGRIADGAGGPVPQPSILAPPPLQRPEVETPSAAGQEIVRERVACPLKPAGFGPARPVTSRYSPGCLRRAIVWAEILGPPVSLRNDKD